MQESWKYLDFVDYNLLYNFSEVLKGKGKQIRLKGANSSASANFEDLRESERMEIRQKKERRRRAYYLIWVVYRYVLGCKTYEETAPYRNAETVTKYHLNSHIKNIYLGYSQTTMVLSDGIVVYLENIWFRKPEHISIILQILYNRYGFYEQFECFINNTTATIQARAVKALKCYKDIEHVYGS